MGDAEHEERHRIEPGEPVPGGVGQRHRRHAQTHQRRQGAAADHHLAAGGVRHIAPDAGADRAGQAGRHQEAAQQSGPVGPVLGQHHQERRPQGGRHQQRPGDHEVAEGGIADQQPQALEGLAQGVAAAGGLALELVHLGEHRGRQPPGEAGGEQQHRVEQHARLAVAAEQGHPHRQRRRPGQGGRQPGEPAPAGLGNALALHVLHRHRAKAAPQAEHHQQADNGESGGQALQPPDRRRHGQHAGALQHRAEHPEALAHRMAAHPGADRQLRDQRAGLADRYQQAGQRPGRPHGADQPGEHGLGVDQQVADLGQHIGENDLEEITGHFPAGFFADVAAGARVFFIGDQRVQPVQWFTTTHRLPSLFLYPLFTLPRAPCVFQRISDPAIRSASPCSECITS